MITGVVHEWAPNDPPFAAAPTWNDITDQVRTGRTHSGLNGQRDVVGAGTATYEVNNELNSTAWLDRNTWYRYRQIRTRIGSEMLWHGWVKKVEHDVGFPDGISQARIEAVDAIGLLLEASSDADFATYAAGTPLGEITSLTVDGRAGLVTSAGAADVIRWILSNTNIADGGSAVAATMPVFVESKQGGNAVQLLQEYLEAEQGRLFAAKVGAPPEVIHVGRYTDLALTVVPPVATFADTGPGYRWLLGSLVLAAPDETYVSDCTYGGVGIDNQRTADPPTDYPPASYVRTPSPIADANWAKANTEMIVELGRQTDTFPRSIRTLVAGPTANTVDMSHPAIVASVGMVAVELTFQTVTYLLVPQSIDHEFGEAGWYCTFGFRSLDRVVAAYGAAQVFTVGFSDWGGADIFGP